jgi:5-formyltetrahydrofolate cyclo-ligase
MQRLRSALSPELAVLAEQAAASHLAGIPELQGTAVVGLYAAIGDELRTTTLATALRARGHTLAYPRITPGQRTLAFHRIDASSELVPGPLGIPQPPAHTEAFAITRLDVLVIPGLAFDHQGGRLGWGQGYYDVTLSGDQRPLCIGYAYACQVVDEVPCDDGDVHMDMLITDAGVVRASARARGLPA